MDRYNYLSQTQLLVEQCRLLEHVLAVLSEMNVNLAIRGSLPGTAAAQPSGTAPTTTASPSGAEVDNTLAETRPSSPLPGPIPHIRVGQPCGCVPKWETYWKEDRPVRGKLYCEHASWATFEIMAPGFSLEPLAEST